MKRMLEKSVEELIILVTVVIMAMSSCGSSKMYHIGTGSELSKSNCSGKYIYK